MNRQKSSLILGGVALAILLCFLTWSRYNRLPTISPDSGVELPPVELEPIAFNARPVVSPLASFPENIEGLDDRSADIGTPTPVPLDSDKDRLLWITKDWVYRGYSAIANRKRGRFKC